MIDFLNFIFQDGLHYFGTWFFTMSILAMIGGIVSTGRRK